jgi:putative transcriptional regulator
MSFDYVEKSSLLISDPYLYDQNFRRSVVLLSEHSSDGGSVGFILNKPLKIPVDTLLSDFPDFSSKVFYGGPVSTERIHFIHTAGDILDGSIAISDGLYWGGDYAKLKFLVQSQLITEKNIRFFVGYSGWDYKQLKDEMKQNSWLVGKNDINYIFNSKPKTLWKQVLQNMGGQYAVIAQMPDQFLLN